MIKFNGKSNFGDGTEKDTASEMTTATKLIGKSAREMFFNTFFLFEEC